MRADENTRAETAEGSFSESAFSERGSAARYAKVLALLPAKAASELPQYLAASCNPDRAVLQLEVLLQRHPAEALTAFVSSALALRASVALFACSQWLGQTLLQNPDLLRLFARPLGLAAEQLAEDFREQFARFRMRSHETPLPVLLARFKRREYVRIFTRELLGLASLPEITGEISALSDVMIEQALSYCESELRSRYQGWPQLRSGQGRVYPARFAVLSLGKLGGNELNYSSDIDLLYLYDDAEDAGAIAIPAREFFTRLAQELTAVLSTRERRWPGVPGRSAAASAGDERGDGGGLRAGPALLPRRGRGLGAAGAAEAALQRRRCDAGAGVCGAGAGADLLPRAQPVGHQDGGALAGANPTRGNAPGRGLAGREERAGRTARD